MLTAKIHDALNAQINAEYWSAYLYLSMSMDAQQQGLPGMANWFYVQWLEEQDHARILQLYLHSQDMPVLLSPIASVPQSWSDPQEMMRETLMHEEEVTAMINDLAELSQKERDFPTLSRLQWFVDEQVEEEDSVRAIIDALHLVAKDSYGLYELDRQLGRRSYRKASALC